jgi:hypothetical protein
MCECYLVITFITKIVLILGSWISLPPVPYGEPLRLLPRGSPNMDFIWLINSSRTDLRIYATIHSINVKVDNDLSPSPTAADVVSSVPQVTAAFRRLSKSIDLYLISGAGPQERTAAQQRLRSQNLAERAEIPSVTSGRRFKEILRTALRSRDRVTSWLRVLASEAAQLEVFAAFIYWWQWQGRLHTCYNQQHSLKEYVILNSDTMW